MFGLQGCWGLGFVVLGFRVRALGFSGLGLKKFRVLGFRVSGLGLLGVFRVQGSEGFSGLLGF